MHTINATAVIPLTESSIELIKKIMPAHPIPDGATHVAYLEDGNATFLTEPDPSAFGLLNFGTMTFLRYYSDIPIEFED